MADQSGKDRARPSLLEGPPINREFESQLDELVALAKRGHRPDSRLFNPPDQWILSEMPILQDMPQADQDRVRREAEELDRAAAEANAAGKAAARAWPEAVVRLDNGGLAFFSQLGVVRRPDLTQYFIDGFAKNRDALAFSSESQELFTGVLAQINRRLREYLDSGETVIQSDRQVGDAPGRSFHARQLLFGGRYMQLPRMWRQLTFDLPRDQWTSAPDILEVSIPHWLDDLGLDEALKERVKEAGLTQLVFKAPTRGLSLHLGFDYVGEHKMGPLSIAMFLVKQSQGLAVQAALSMARTKTLQGKMANTALVTVGPSLHGKSTLTIMIELANSRLAQTLGLSTDPAEGVYPMNDDIVLLQRLDPPVSSVHDGKPVTVPYSIDGTENNLYAVPFGLTRDDDPITYDTLRGSPIAPNAGETLENVPVDPDTGMPKYGENPVRNMRMILSRLRLLERKGAQHLMGSITGGALEESVHVPMEHTDRVFWQAVMRQNTVIPPLRRVTLEQYIRVLMYGEAVQMGAAIGAIGRPYVEYFSDPFIIGLEDDNANLLFHILKEMEAGGLPQYYYAFNTGGVGADTNEEASGAGYKKIPRELTLMLQEALLREAVKFEHDPVLGSDVAVAIVDANGNTAVDLSGEWLPWNIYGNQEYARRIAELSQRRYYGRDAADKAGILRYTKVTNDLYDLRDIPNPGNERELAWLLSFYWNVDQAYNSLPELTDHLGMGGRPPNSDLSAIAAKYRDSGLQLPRESADLLNKVGLVL